MNHTKAKRNLVSYARGDLKESQMTAVREHLRECALCRDELASVARLHSELKQTVSAYWNCLEPGPNLAAGLVTNKLAESQSPGWLAGLRSSRPWFTPAGVAAISLLFVLVMVAGVPPIRDRVANALGIQRTHGIDVTVVGRDLTLVMRVPQTDYRLGDTVVATVGVTNMTSRPVDLAGYDGQYLNLSVEDEAGRQVFDWLTNAYVGTTASGLTTTLALQPGASITRSLQFTATEAGVFALKGATADGLLVTNGIAIRVAATGSTSG